MLDTGARDHNLSVATKKVGGDSCKSSKTQVLRRDSFFRIQNEGE
jgi:hypothetical protein